MTNARRLLDLLTEAQGPLVIGQWYVHHGDGQFGEVRKSTGIHSETCIMVPVKLLKNGGHQVVTYSFYYRKATFQSSNTRYSHQEPITPQGIVTEFGGTEGHKAIERIQAKMREKGVAYDRVAKTDTDNLAPHRPPGV